MATPVTAATAAQAGLLASVASAVLGFFGFFMALAKLLLVAAALGTGFGAPIVLMAWWLNRKNKK
jgi:hypothetical protein